MPPSDQFQLLANLADERSETALRRLAVARQSLGVAREQLRVLTEYGSDYHTRLGRESSEGIGSDMLRNYQGFMSNVAQAIVQQKNEVSKREDMCRHAEAAWREAQRQLESYKTLAQRNHIRQRVKEERVQQKSDDEYSARAGFFGVRTSI
jgi:flagellar FliJ protein